MQGLKLLQKIFETHLEQNSLKDFYLSDPVWFPKRFNGRDDIEVAAFVSAIFAIGPRYAIIKSLEKIFSALGNSPCDAIRNLDEKALSRTMSGHIQFAYKNIMGKDFVQILSALKVILDNHGTIENALMEQRDGDGNVVMEILTGLLEEMKSVRVGRSLGGELTPRARLFLRARKKEVPVRE